MNAGTEAPAAVALEGIAKKFSEFVALHGISLSIGAGEGEDISHMSVSLVSKFALVTGAARGIGSPSRPGWLPTGRGSPCSISTRRPRRRRRRRSAARRSGWPRT
jgi:hypothetical protein